VFSKASQLADGFGAHVYVVFQFNGKYHVYDSGSRQQWPPSAEMIISSCSPYGLGSDLLTRIGPKLPTSRTVLN
jgi:hypothetical protein